MHMRSTIKKISIINIYGFKFLSLSLSLLCFYINFFWIYTWVYSFFFLFLFTECLMIYLYWILYLLHLINSLRTKMKKKNLNRALDAKLDNNWNPISFGYTHEFTLSFFFSIFVYWVFDGLFILDPSSFAPH